MFVFVWIDENNFKRHTLQRTGILKVASVDDDTGSAVTMLWIARNTERRGRSAIFSNSAWFIERTIHIFFDWSWSKSTWWLSSNSSLTVSFGGFKQSIRHSLLGSVDPSNCLISRLYKTEWAEYGWCVCVCFGCDV